MTPINIPANRTAQALVDAERRDAERAASADSRRDFSKALIGGFGASRQRRLDRLRKIAPSVGKDGTVSSEFLTEPTEERRRLEEAQREATEARRLADEAAARE